MFTEAFKRIILNGPPETLSSGSFYSFRNSSAFTSSIRKQTAMRVNVFYAVLLGCAVAGAGRLQADEHSSALRLESRLNWKLNNRWSAGGNIQARLRDRFSEFYYRKLDAGVNVKISDWLLLPVNLRLEDRTSSNGSWYLTNFILLDPTVKLPAWGHWRFDVRTRLQYMLNQGELQFIRVQPRLWYSFNRKRRTLGWWVYDDYYFRLIDWGIRTSYFSNNFCTGINYPFNSHADVNLYYMLFSAKATPDAVRRHSHQACVSLGFSIGGRKPGVPPQSTN